MRARRSTPHRDSPRAALLIEQFRSAVPALASAARQRWIQVRVTLDWSQRYETASGERLQPRRYGRIGFQLPRRQQLGHDFTPVGDEDALARPHAAKVLAETVFEVTNPDGFHGD